jgi:single-strand DNA-binding protein
MANLELSITGVVSKKSEKANVGQTYESQLLIVTTEDETYPQDYPVEMQKNTFQYLDEINEGDKVEINVNVRGKKWTNPQGEDKYFVTLAGYRVSKK